MKVSVLREPDDIRILSESGKNLINGNEVLVEFLMLNPERMQISVTGAGAEIKQVVLQWKGTIPSDYKILGDAWERAYGDLEFLTPNPYRSLPWYFIASGNTETVGVGVEVQPAAFCSWKTDLSGISLTLDLRSGGSGVLLGETSLKTAVVVQHRYEENNSFTAAKDFCRRLCPNPLLPSNPVYGTNNWYYAYGSSSHKEILENGEELRQLTSGLKNRPSLIIDDGWQKYRRIYGDDYIGGPWDKGNNQFPDMAGLADELADKEIIPGIWFRPLSDASPDIPESWKLQRNKQILDPTVPGVMEKLENDVSRLSEWGYRILKHDFSTFDLLGLWGSEMKTSVTEDGWHFHDRTRTNAQIITDLYRLIRKSAGPAMILGCNCIGHLGAGLMEINRIGDDTSGIDWSRTRKMGINCLAFRSPQNGTFFAADADCVGITEKISWENNRQWLHLLAHSGTPLFYSAKPGTMSAAQKDELSAALSIASKAEISAEPLNWTESRLPNEWQYGEKTLLYNWNEE